MLQNALFSTPKLHFFWRCNVWLSVCLRWNLEKLKISYESKLKMNDYSKISGWRHISTFINFKFFTRNETNILNFLNYQAQHYSKQISSTYADENTPCVDFHASPHQHHSNSIHPQNKREFTIENNEFCNISFFTLLHIEKDCMIA